MQSDEQAGHTEPTARFTRGVAAAIALPVVAHAIYLLQVRRDLHTVLADDPADYDRIARSLLN